MVGCHSVIMRSKIPSNSCTYLHVLWIPYADVLQKLHQHHRYLNGDVDTAVIE